MSELIARTLRVASIGTAVLAAICFAVFASVLLGKDMALDFGVYWRASGEPLSVVYAPRATLPFAYPPTMLLWISPLRFVPVLAAYALWVGLSLAALAAACRQHLSKWQTFLVIASPPVFYCMLMGQTSVLLTAAILWACTTERRLLAGAALALAISVKPQLAIMAPLMFYRDREMLFAMAATMFAAVLATFVFFGAGVWQTWFESLGHFGDVVRNNGVMGVTITPLAVAKLKEIPQLPVLLVCVPLALGLVFACRDGQPLEKAAAVATASLMVSPYAIIYDLTAIMPLIVWHLWRGKIVAAIAYVGGFNPMPLVVSGSLLILGARKGRSRDGEAAVRGVAGGAYGKA